MGSDEVVGERRELLNTRDGDVLDATLLAGLKELVVDLAWKRRWFSSYLDLRSGWVLTSAKDVTPDFLRSSEVRLVRLGDVALEVGLANHLRQVRAGPGVTQKVLREEVDEWLAEVAVDLATKNVELKNRQGSVRMRLKGERGTHVVGWCPEGREVRSTNS